MSNGECRDHLGNVYSSKKDMCAFYGIKVGTLEGRLGRGWSLADALTKPLVPEGTLTDRYYENYSCVDHLGKEFQSLLDMCDYYNISYPVYAYRQKRGWSLEKTLTTPSRVIVDHLGNSYKSVQEMCNHWKINSWIYRGRIRRGWSVEEALTLPLDKQPSPDKVRTIRTVEDHLGNSFSTLGEMLNYYGVSSSAYHRRIKAGMSLEEVLISRRYGAEDHLGNKYSSITEMLNHYGVSRSYYDKQLKRGVSLEDILTKRYFGVNKDDCIWIDHLGVQYATLSELCSKYGITEAQYRWRMRNNWSLEEVLTVEHRRHIDRFFDHLGNGYETRQDMLDYYGLSGTEFHRRTHMGWSLEEILTTPYAYSCVDHLGNEYRSVAEMCETYDIPRQTYFNRRKSGWSLEDILTKDLRHGKECVDHLGNVYAQQADMCKAWGVSRHLYESRIARGWSVQESLTLPKRMYIGEYRVSECLKRLGVKFYHDCKIKTIFQELNISVDWNEFLDELQRRLSLAGYAWSKSKIERLRPDFVLYEDEKHNIRGVIEFDGEQHQNFVEFFFKTIDCFCKRINADFVKQSVWEYLNIPMLRIRYDQVDSIDSMVQDFIDYPNRYLENHNTYLSEDEYWSVLQNQKEIVDLAFA